MLSSTRPVLHSPRPAFTGLGLCLLLALSASAFAESNGGAEQVGPAGTTATSAPAPIPAGGASTTTTTTSTDPVTTGGQKSGAKPAGGGGLDMNFLLIMAVPLALMWFMASRSQKKEAKRQDSLRSGLKRGDKVVTIGGAHGEVVTVGESTIDLRMGSGDDAAVITFNKSAVGSVAGAPAAEPVKAN